jgi:hypothetical protein
MRTSGSSRGPITPGLPVRWLRDVVAAWVRPLGYLTFVVALAALSATAALMGERHELGFFAGRLDKSIRRYPEVTRKGVRMAWFSWLALLLIAISPLDPLATRWDEALLVALALAILWRRRLADRPSGR